MVMVMAHCGYATSSDAWVCVHSRDVGDVGCYNVLLCNLCCTLDYRRVNANIQ